MIPQPQPRSRFLITLNFESVITEVTIAAILQPYIPTGEHYKVQTIYGDIESTLRFRPAPAPATCTWTENEDYGMYETGCGHAFQTIEGDIEENKFKYCPYCGGKILEAQR